MTTVSWVGLEVDSSETCTVSEFEDGVWVESTVTASFGECIYSLRADEHWNFRSLTIQIGSRKLEIEFDGTLWKVDGLERHDLYPAREVDIAVSPMSNTLPIRRLGLTIGERAAITTAYIAVPELSVQAHPQSYTRLTDHTYRYESRSSSYQNVITVDDFGLVVSYPGAFARASR
ncbi:MAG: putative glycolipid-binding domain-containing protein [Cryobacterium sp.]|nr:putative glycolipid-binding domain-containing protein [Cryobacterium sp.]MBX3104423.1 putative glycolipid-binding domain-containing protein [Cryobacterium sp.]